MDAKNTPHIAAQDLLQLRNAAPAPLIIDVRRETVFLSAPDMIAGALRHDPATVADWAETLPTTSNIVVYCVHGHEVSQNAAKALRERGLPAQFLEGGIEAWRATGGELTANPARTGGKTS
jgi:rhodanese-related sulfurtransferase